MRQSLRRRVARADEYTVVQCLGAYCPSWETFTLRDDKKLLVHWKSKVDGMWYYAGNEKATLTEMVRCLDPIPPDTDRPTGCS